MGDLARHEAGAALVAVNRAHVDGRWMRGRSMESRRRSAGRRTAASVSRTVFLPPQGAARAGRGRRRDHALERPVLRQRGEGCRGAVGGLYGDLKPAPDTPGMDRSSVSSPYRRVSLRVCSTSSPAAIRHGRRDARHRSRVGSDHLHRLDRHRQHIMNRGRTR